MQANGVKVLDTTVNQMLHRKQNQNGDLCVIPWNRQKTSNERGEDARGHFELSKQIQWGSGAT